MAKKSGGKSKGAPKSAQIGFDYLKSNFFRVIHCDGAIGGITPGGYIHMSLYSERQAIPRRIVHDLKSDGTLGAEVSRETRGTVVREMEVDVILSEADAIALYQWVGEKISALQKIRSAVTKKTGAESKK